jgi:LAGLIDADG endonuclease
MFFIILRKYYNLVKLIIILKKNSGTYIVSNSNYIALIIHLFNDNLILPKRIKQLKEWLTVYRQNPNNYYISLIDNSIKLSLKIAWISGFTYAEGSFNVHITKRVEQRVGFRTKLWFLLDQQYENNYFVTIKNLFSIGYLFLRCSIYEVYRYSVDSLKGINAIKELLYPLKISKKESFSKWCDIYVLMIENKHLYLERYAKIK